MALAVRPVRNTSASSMQSPPASADATSGQQLVPRVGSTRRISQVNVAVHQLTQTQMVGQGDRQEQSGIGHQTVIIEGDVDAVGAAQW